MRAGKLVAAIVTTAIVLGAEVAAAGMMHPRLAAHLSGMGEKGIVNFRSQAAKGRLCWTFQLHTMGVTGASIRDKSGMKLTELGMHYRAKGCTMVAKKTLRQIEAHPRSYSVWVDTKGHPGDLRGKLFAGMAHM